MDVWRRLLQSNSPQQSTVDHLANGLNQTSGQPVQLRLVYATILMLWVEFTHHTQQTFRVFIDTEVGAAETL